jgi:hypothetical protein
LAPLSEPSIDGFEFNTHGDRLMTWSDAGGMHEWDVRTGELLADFSSAAESAGASSRLPARCSTSTA